MASKKRQILDDLKELCRKHNVLIRFCFDTRIEIVEKSEIDPVTSEWPNGEIHIDNLTYIDGHSFIFHRNSLMTEEQINEFLAE